MINAEDHTARGVGKSSLSTNGTHVTTHVHTYEQRIRTVNTYNRTITHKESPQMAENELLCLPVKAAFRLGLSRTDDVKHRPKNVAIIKYYVFYIDVI